MRNIKYFYWELSDNEFCWGYEERVVKKISSMSLETVTLDFTNIQVIKLQHIEKLLRLLFNFAASFEIIVSGNQLNKLKDIHSLLKGKKVQFIIDASLTMHQLEELRNLKLDHHLFLFLLTLDRNNYKSAAQIIQRIEQKGYHRVRVQIREIGKDRVRPQDVFDMVMCLDKLQKSEIGIQVEYYTTLTTIKDRLKNNTVNSIYLNHQGFIGVFPFFPTYYEHITAGDIVGSWRRYIQLYLQQDINFYSRKALLNEALEDQQALRNLSLKHGKYDRRPQINRHYHIVKSDEGCNLYHENGQLILQMSEFGNEIISFMDGKKTIWNVVEAAVLNKDVADRSKASYEVIKFIDSLYTEQVLS